MALLDPDTIYDQFTEAHTAMRPLLDNFNEYERIARNRPHPKVIAAKLPTVTDGTLAGIINRTPKRIIQQIPTGRVKSLDQPELAKVIDFIWTNHILQNANYNGTPMLKSWMMLKKALTHGMSASYDFFARRGDYFGADFSIPYIRDLIFEAGKAYGPDCDVFYLRQWFTPAQVKLIIEREGKLGERAKARGESYEGNWSVPMLEKLVDGAHAKDADAMTEQEREKGLVSKFIPIVHAFQTGIDAKFYSFSPDLKEFDNKENPILKTEVNDDPRGKLPINFLYAEADLSSALGIGLPEMTGGMQNLLDSEVQSYQLMQKLMLNPPVKKWGADVKKASVKWKPNAVWDMGASKATSDIEPVNIVTEAIQNFANNYGLIKSQIMNMAPQDGSQVSAEAGNSQSKTHAGVEQANQTLGFDDNYLRKQYESWWEANSETMLNIHLAKSDGKREIELTEDFIKNTMPGLMNDKGQSTIKQVRFDPAKQKATILYDQVKTRAQYIVDPTTSESPDDADQVANLKEVIADAANAPYMYYYILNAGKKLNLGEAYIQLLQKLGVQNIDKIIEDLPEGADMPEELRGVMNPLYDKPSINITYDQLPIAGRIQAAANAGITLTPADILAGPPLDPNARGTITPQSPTGIIEPGGQMSGGSMAPAAAAPASPDGTPLATQPTTGVMPPAGAPAGPPQAPMAPAPAAGPAPFQPTVPPQERDLLNEFLKEDYSAKQALAGLNLAKKGMATEDIAHVLGEPEGLSNAPKKKAKATEAK